MVKHIVMWTLKEFAEGRGREENARLMKERLEDLPARIDVIRRFEVGMNFNDSVDAFDIVLYSEFETKEDLEMYQAHPAHVEARDFIRTVREEHRVVDYEV